MARITIESALSDVVEILQDQGHLEDNEELTGALASLEALIQGKANTFDGSPIRADNVLVGIEMN